MERMKSNRRFEFFVFLQNEDEHVMKNIEELNLITTNTEVKPNYSLENKETSIEVFFNDAGQVLIVGVVDNNYIYWASLTDSSDKEMNANIFDYISRGSVRKVSHLYQVIVAAGLSYEEIRRWVKICLRRKPDDPMSWLTPFEGNFCSTQIQHNGKFFARDIAGYMDENRKKCRFREAGGAYEKVLDYYLSVFNEDDGDDFYYVRIKNLIRIIESEEYLYGSENLQIRRKYIELRKKTESLYNRYMSAVR